MASNRIISLLSALTIVLAFLPVSGASAQTSGEQGNGQSEEATVSADGRYVAFQSDATNLVPGDSNGLRDAFVRDRTNAVTQRVSLSSSGTQANGFVDNPQISPDGRYVVFEAGATNLVSGDSNGVEDVFVRDLTSGTTSRVSLSSSGAQGNAVSEHAHMSSDGRYVVFESEATNLVSSDTNAAQDIFVRDRSLGTTTRVSTSSSGSQANGFSAEPVISPDGRYVGFHSAATNLVSNDSNDDWDIYVKDLSGGAVVRASLSSNENQTTERSANAWLSDQALQIAFESDATNLVWGDTNGVKDIFVRDRIATTTERASVSSSESQANQSSQWPSISSNGGYVAFESFATNLVSGDANGSRDVFLRDRSAGTTTRVSVSSSGQEANGPSTVGMVAGGGGHVVFRL